MTESFKPLLDRDFSRVAAKPVTDYTGPLLREIINYATWAWRRCEVDAHGKKNEDVAAFILYRQVIEMVDGVEVLTAESCALATVPLLRSAFEAVLSLEYILQEETKYVERSLSWFTGYLHKRLTRFERLDPATVKGADFKKAWEESFGPWNPPTTASTATNALQQLLATAQFLPIEAEYQRIHQKRRNPPWYSLFGGPNNVRSLAEHLGRIVEYDELYTAWSTVIHANDLPTYVHADEKGTTSFISIRDPENLARYAFFAATILLRATRLMVRKFRLGEPLETWYKEEIREWYNRLAGMQVTVNRFE